MSESRRQENGFFYICKGNSSKNPINDMESTARDEDVPTSTESNVPSSANGAELVAESVINTRSSAPADCSWKPDNSDAPKVPEGFTKVAETKFQMKVEEFFNLYFSDKAVNFIESFHRRRGDKEFSCSSWCPHDKFGHVRDVSFQHPIKLYFGMSLLSYMNLFPCIIIPADFSIYFGANFGSCQETQKFRIYRNSHLVIETSQEINNVPYGDYFIVEGLWSVERDINGQREDCILRVYVNLAFSKRTVWKGLPLPNVNQFLVHGVFYAFVLWSFSCFPSWENSAVYSGRMSRSLCNLDSHGLDPSGSSIENGELQIKREVAQRILQKDLITRLIQ
ncbi:protein VASCULAR ASSOCIATED DEATH 1, chloroplastic-like isoform X5 [Gossypium raimondii]|nr:protein VASCULAR ASSOCIATED DEATH 1, chloroplastic-like isoform X5 [Gossypium raimondii]